MEIVSSFLVVVLLFPLLCFGLELFLTRRESKAALIAPVVVMCLTIWLGWVSLLTGIIMYVIYGVMHVLRKRKASEMDQMKLEDL